MKKLIINADDFGYSRAVTYGIFDSYKIGILTSTTMMMNTTATEHAAELAQKNPGLGVGVHLVLTFGRPLLNTHKTIVDENGNFRKLSFYENDGFKVDLEEVYSEWKAQIEKFLSYNLKPTHLDSHHHINSFGELYRVYLRLAKEYDLPVRNNVSNIKEIDSGIKTTDSFQMEYKEALENVEDIAEIFLKYDSVEVMTHPSYLDKFIMESSSFNLPRLEETDFLTDKNRVKAFRESNLFKLATFNEL
jgi:predicted glycoside hydrolase/deacetylase ChbG (UPF0249 family)